MLYCRLLVGYAAENVGKEGKWKMWESIVISLVPTSAYFMPLQHIPAMVAMFFLLFASSLPASFHHFLSLCKDTERISMKLT